MLKIYHYDDENFHIIFRVYDKEGIKTISKILTKMDDSIYLDWEYLFEEINDKDPIIGKKLEVKLHYLPSGKKAITVSPLKSSLEVLAFAFI